MVEIKLELARVFDYNPRSQHGFLITDHEELIFFRRDKERRLISQRPFHQEDSGLRLKWGWSKHHPRKGEPVLFERCQKPIKRGRKGVAFYWAFASHHIYNHHRKFREDRQLQRAARRIERRTGEERSRTRVDGFYAKWKREAA